MSGLHHFLPIRYDLLRSMIDLACFGGTMFLTCANNHVFVKADALSVQHLMLWIGGKLSLLFILPFRTYYEMLSKSPSIERKTC